MSNSGREKNGLSGKEYAVENRDHIVYNEVPTTLEYDDSRDEKPWQRVIYQATRKGQHLYEPVKSVPSAALLVVIGLYCLLAFLTQVVEDDMPRVTSEADIRWDNSETFSEETAWQYLNTIIGDGPRVSGTRYHLQKTQDLKNLVDTVANRATLPVRTAWQINATGDYNILMDRAFVNVYRNVSNVIALLEGDSGFHSNGTIGTSLLVNCHYDSVPYAIGVSDDAIFCAVMLETLEKLSRRTTKFKHNVIFLFNGAEENGLQASHAFLQHPWAAGITNVINLEAAGINGKPNVFQVTDPRLLRAYQRVTGRPNGQSLGEFLFTMGIVPSDTDFRIWRDFGNFHGLDIAFVKGGHVYHTRYDHPDLVRAGVVQNAGDMLLGLVRELADMEELETQIEPSAAVYFDFLNWFMVTYSYVTALLVDITIALFGLLSVGYYVWLVGPRSSTIRELLYSALGRIAAICAGVLVSLITVPLMVATTNQLRYLSEPWIVAPLYWLPFLISAILASQYFDAWRVKKCGLNRSLRALQAQAATRLLLSLLLLLLCCIPSLATIRYVVSTILAITAIMALVSISAVRYVRMQAWQHLLLELSLSLPGAMFAFTLALRFSSLVLPVMGRFHTDVPDYFVAALSVGLAILCSTTISGIELLFSRKRLWLVYGPLAVCCVVTMFVPVSPYRDEGPAVQRHYWFHSEIVTYDVNNVVTNRETGVLVTKYDVYTLDTVLPALREKNINLNSRTDFTEWCENYVNCNMPLFRARFGAYLENSLFLYMDGPAAITPESGIRMTSRVCTGEICNYEFTMTGPAHNLITIWPRANVNLTSWSFQSQLQPSTYKAGRPVYTIVESTATYSDTFQPLVFTITAIVPLSLQPAVTLAVSHHAHLISHPEHYTQEYSNLIDAVPKYFNIATFQSFRRNYVF